LLVVSDPLKDPKKLKSQRGEEKTLKTHKSHTENKEKFDFPAHEKETRICSFENLVQG
jgi:hypothetical protein